eukprot:GHRR01011135.1.p2 GENE.GHRR01011135.1~~GHRR01011135.1.p2  ORF type:complete len:109 (+),score=33.97 GHRR01011135.1:1560-1886(+)
MWPTVQVGNDEVCNCEAATSPVHCCCSACTAALQIFIDAKPDVIILEVGIGGRIDATNILAAPAVTGVCVWLGMRHMLDMGQVIGISHSWLLLSPDCKSGSPVTSKTC